MKDSYYTTPRTLNDAVFIPSADPIVRTDVAAPLAIQIHVWILCIAVVAVTAWRFA